MRLASQFNGVQMGFGAAALCATHAQALDLHAGAQGDGVRKRAPLRLKTTGDALCDGARVAPRPDAGALAAARVKRGQRLGTQAGAGLPWGRHHTPC